MLRLGRRGIILSLFINSLNITLYLIILVAACLNIIEASVNFIILNASAAFGCLVASPIAFNLYGGIIVVCMGIAFFMMSFVTLIPPLDGMILNYKKLDRWKEQRHFRVQLEAQRIFEQQLQQEQNLARVNPVHHANALTIHAHSHHAAHLASGVGSPKLQRPLGTGVGTGSLNFAGGVGTTLTGMFSPPQTQQSDIDNPMPHLPPQPRLYGSLANFVPQVSHEHLPDSRHGDPLTGLKGRGATGTGHGRSTRDGAEYQLQQNFEKSQPDRGMCVPPIVTSGLRDNTTVPATQTQTTAYFPLSPPCPRRHSVAESSIATTPDSPALQYLPVGNEEHYSLEGETKGADPSLGSKAEWTPNDEKSSIGGGVPTHNAGGDRILKSAAHPMNHDSVPSRTPSQPQPHPILPLRTTNKPAPPHDPFRKTSISSVHSNQNTATSSTDANMTLAPIGSSRNSTKTGYHSLYQPPEPPRQYDKAHPLQQYTMPHYQSDITTAEKGFRVGNNGPGGFKQGDIALTATGRILSSIGGISGCYGIVGGLPTQDLGPLTIEGGTTAVAHSLFTLPTIHVETVASSASASAAPAQDGKVSSSRQRGSHVGNDPHSILATTRYMPDIVLTLPTPAEHGHGNKREEYFGI
ncbi:hypothetical protein BGZ94_008020 [Podila epigama]|nr:hypothetical protein BGZ94_008020 [Podila epigama]